MKFENGYYTCDIDITEEEWIDLLKDKKVTKNEYKFVLLMFLNEPDHASTCKEIGDKYNLPAQSINARVISFCKAVHKKLNRYDIFDGDTQKFWHFAMKGRNVGGYFEWTLRPELASALEKCHLSWIPFYEEFAQKLLSYKNNRVDLIRIVYGLEEKYVKNLYNADGSELSDVDPYSVFALMNKGLPDDQRIAVAEYFKTALKVEASLPNDFDGIPIMSVFHTYFFDKEIAAKEIPILWDLYEAELSSDKNRLVEAFDALQQFKWMKWNITMGMYWVKPNDYLSLDTNNRLYLQKMGVSLFKETEINADNYLKLLNSLKDKLKSDGMKVKDIPALTYEAWRENLKISEEERGMWLAGYTYKEGSQLERFVKEGIWEGYFDVVKEKKQIELVGEIKSGDVLALKSHYTKGSNHNIPCLKISAIGIVREKVNKEVVENGFQLVLFKVNYIDFETKEFEGSSHGSYFKTIHRVKSQEINEYIMSKINKTDISMETVDPVVKEYAELLKISYNLILTGAPGTGKTHLAKAIANYMSGEDLKWNFVQFHPSYDYTDFVEGLRPISTKGNGVGFERRNGIFKKFCTKALESPDKAFVFIIDEINRGEISKIFGELFFSIDPGYRGGKDHKICTQYQGLEGETDLFDDGFYVPENVYVIGTMNDIDRSVESMDFAMRRRFAWKEITAEQSKSMLDSEKAWKGSKPNDEVLKTLKKKMDSLNDAVLKERNLGKAYQIGASYFLNYRLYSEKENPYENLWKYHLEGLLAEYLRGTSDAGNRLNALKAAYDLKTSLEVTATDENID